ncbi:hypothetical protein EPK99_14360 [Neorhizobium lilium]|uniref:Yip1 domain-containing protein n=1 Tax=Neorhizobium lilium TaxID=2503024 RepID=A0A444LFG8_9HYPH|nr:hypothetical protein [Neorhizobium lilium]RWX76851.1 hypothetical protein EPK99_14360 [Neorhizobium lilium]
MPSYHEVRLYLSGLWLLVKGDAQGFRLLDISNRGITRSFWAYLWCVPAMAVSWGWMRLSFLQASPPETRAGFPFFLRLAMIEAINWIVPLILIGALCLLLGLARKFPAIVVAMNWLSVPFAYVSAVLMLGVTLLPGASHLFAVLEMALLFAGVACSSRILRLICGPETLTVTAMVLLLFVPDWLLTVVLQQYLGISFN